MKLNLLEFLKQTGRYFFKFAIKSCILFKPILRLIDPKIRARFKTRILRLAFKTLYSVESNAVVDASLKKGVTLIGYPHAEIGEGEFLRQTARAFLKIDIDFGIYNFNSKLQFRQNDQRLVPFIRSDNQNLTNIFHLKPDQVEAFIISLGYSSVKGHYNIGYWAWELSVFPEAWMMALEYFHEIWCPSRFIQSSVSERYTRPAIYMPPAFEIEDPKGFDRSYFKLSKDKFLFLFVFDFKSYFSRKNPLGCVQAFQDAFPESNETVGLVLKSMDGKRYPHELARLNELIKADPRITFIDSIFSPKEVIGLMSVCDSFVSLHRSEGLGLSIAQSMLLGKPVITTGYSGNTDFTRPDNSCLVDYKLIKVKEGEYPYHKGQLWADPNIDQAAAYMRRLVEDDVYRNTVAKAGYSYIKSYHSFETVGKKYRDRLVELGLLKT